MLLFIGITFHRHHFNSYDIFLCMGLLLFSYSWPYFWSFRLLPYFQHSICYHLAQKSDPNCPISREGKRLSNLKAITFQTFCTKDLSLKVHLINFGAHAILAQNLQQRLTSVSVSNWFPMTVNMKLQEFTMFSLSLLVMNDQEEMEWGWLTPFITIIYGPSQPGWNLNDCIA